MTDTTPPVPDEHRAQAAAWRDGYAGARADHPRPLAELLAAAAESDRDAVRAAYFAGWEAGKAGPAG